MDFDLICGDSKLATVAKMLFFTGFGTGVLVILLLIYRVIFSRFFSCKATSVKDQSKDFSNPHKVKQTGTFYPSNYRKSITVHVNCRARDAPANKTGRCARVAGGCPFIMMFIIITKKSHIDLI